MPPVEHLLQFRYRTNDRRTQGATGDKGKNVQYRYGGAGSPKRNEKISKSDAFPALSTLQDRHSRRADAPLSQTYDACQFGVHRPTYHDEDRFLKSGFVEKQFPPFHTVGAWKRWNAVTRSSDYQRAAEKQKLRGLQQVRKVRIDSKLSKLRGLRNLYRETAVRNFRALEKAREFKKTLVTAASRVFKLPKVQNWLSVGAVQEGVVPSGSTGEKTSVGKGGTSKSSRFARGKSDDSREPPTSGRKTTGRAAAAGDRLPVVAGGVARSAPRPSGAEKAPAFGGILPSPRAEEDVAPAAAPDLDFDPPPQKPPSPQRPAYFSDIQTTPPTIFSRTGVQRDPWAPDDDEIEEEIEEESTAKVPSGVPRSSLTRLEPERGSLIALGGTTHDEDQPSDPLALSTGRLSGAALTASLLEGLDVLGSPALTSPRSEVSARGSPSRVRSGKLGAAVKGEVGGPLVCILELYGS